MNNLYVQIPLLSEWRCDDIVKEVKDNETIVGGCVVDDSAEFRENHMIDSIRKTKESYLLEQPGDYRNNPNLDWSWLQDKMYNTVKIVNDYLGGDLQFGMKDKNERWITVPKKKGTITIFPSFLSHRVSHVQRGPRYSIQEFYVGSSFV